MRSLSTLLYNTLRAEEVTIEQESATVLWIAMQGIRLERCALPLATITFIRAIHLQSVVEVHGRKPAVSAAVTRVDGGPRGGWELVAAGDPEPG
ncbi:hypothetical protein GQ600_6364 [Phytophthora cactorum]|nr:hypothetical protein GQ600_6364 [Phytophthora cactorum]